MTTNADQASAQNTAADLTPAAPTTPPDGETPEGKAPQPERVEDLPDWAQKLIKDTRKEAERNRKRIDDERTQAEEKRLADEKKWQELAEQRAKERDDYKPYKERYETLANQQRAALTAEVAKWPASVKALLPGEDADVSVLADAVNKGRALVAELTAKAEQPPKPNGVPATPKAQGNMDAAQQEAQRREVALQQYREL